MYSAPLGMRLLDPGDIEKNAAMRAAAALAHFAPNTAGDVIAGEQFRRAARILIALGVAPAFLFVVGRLIDVQRRNVVEHEAAAILVAQDATLAANSFGDQNSANAGRPNHSGGMKLDELHVH